MTSSLHRLDLEVEGASRGRAGQRNGRAVRRGGRRSPVLPGPAKAVMWLAALEGRNAGILLWLFSGDMTGCRAHRQ